MAEIHELLQELASVNERMVARIEGKVEMELRRLVYYLEIRLTNEIITVNSYFSLNLPMHKFPANND